MRFGRCLARVSGQGDCLECAQEVCLSLWLQQCELVVVMQAFFTLKQENVKWFSRLVQAPQV